MQYIGPKVVDDATTRQAYLPEYVDPYAFLEDKCIFETAPISIHIYLITSIARLLIIKFLPNVV